MKRECGSCTKCCDGWLTGNVGGEDFYPGKACIFSNTGCGCKNYKNRPIDPCINYNCAWILHEEIPESFKPSESNTIISISQVDKYPYAELLPAGDKIDSRVLSWFIIWGLRKYGNVLWLDDDRVTYHLGSEGFSNIIRNGKIKNG